MMCRLGMLAAFGIAASLTIAPALPAAAEDPVILAGVVDLPLISGDLVSCDQFEHGPVPPGATFECIKTPIVGLRSTRTYADWLERKGWTVIKKDEFSYVAGWGFAPDRCHIIRLTGYVSPVIPENAQGAEVSLITFTYLPEVPCRAGANSQ